MFRLVWLCGLVVAAGCKTESKPAAGASQAHDLPGIDCPLRKAGVNPSGLRPFAEVEKYIAFLERPDRAAWQKPDEVVKAVALQGNETVFDLGYPCYQPRLGERWLAWQSGRHATTDTCSSAPYSGATR